ncbi:MAG: 3-hydroxyacyl-ACP dehydratase FabZ [Eubacteriales bacterium]|nr:3-hydroxyacyl-ACP dehydratase FabZ [Eubacteriales bacterium]
MNREEIKTIIPHREPMLLLDEVEMEGEYAHGTYTVTGEEWFLKGHYPGNPVVPGVVLCEIMAQTCAILLGDALKGKTPYYTGIDKVRFKHMVKPGDTLRISATITKNKGNFYFTTCQARVGETLYARGELSFALVEGN